MHLRKLLRIARWEVTKNAGGIDRRTALVAVAGIVLMGAVVPIAVGGSGGVALDEGLYRIGVDESSPYHQVAEADETFTVVAGADGDDLQAGRVELLILDGRLQTGESAKALAAYDTFRESVTQYNDGQMLREDNRTAAFPVSVLLEYREQLNVRTSYGQAGAGSGGGTGGTGGGTGGGTDDGGTAGGGTAGGGTTGGGTGGSGGSGGGAPGGVGGLGAGLSGSDGVSGTPSDIAPPFPFQSLVLAFVFIIPLNFLIQAYGSTILSERIKRRGELMLVSPVTRTDIIAGKTLPYFLGALAVEGLIAGGLTYLQHGTLGGGISLLAVLPLVLLFLGATFLGAMFARSFKELTFVTVTITVTLTSYAFVPAIFTDANSVALISPLTLVVRDLQNQAISAPAFAFSTIPPLLTALVLFGLGAGLYREEDMFTQRPMPLKVLDSLAGRVRRPWHVGLMSALLLPFVFVLELLAIALLFALGSLSIPLVLVFVALIEEVGKSLHIYAAHAHRRFDRTVGTALKLGVFSGLGFFLAEKLTVLAQAVGLADLPIGNAALQTGIVSPPVLVAALLAPLVLHVVTASISALGARKGRRPYVAALGVAIVVHLGYNLVAVNYIA